MITALGAIVWAACVAGPTDGDDGKPQRPVERLAFGFLGPEIVKISTDVSGLVAADVDGDGKTDLVVANNQKLKIEFLLQGRTSNPDPPRTTEGPNDPPDDSRFSRKSILTEKKVTSLACGDWNGDGRTDVAYYGDPKELVVVFRGADGAYATRREFRITDGSASPSALRTADFDHDGKTDLLLLGEECFYLLLQKGGTLAEPIKIPLIDKGVSGITTADLDGDGRVDLLFTSPGDARPVRIRFQESDGHFGPELRYKLPAISAWEAADLDGDGRAEVLVIEAASNRMRVLGLAPSEKKSGSLGKPRLFALSKDAKDRSLAVGDLDGDKKADVVVSDPAGAQLLVFRSDAAGALSRVDSYPSLTAVRTVRVADLDGDGRDEVVVLSSDEKAIGIAKFDAAGGRLGFPKPIATLGDPVSMDATDVNGDGLADLVYVGKTDKKLSLVVVPGTRNGFGEPQSTELSGFGNDPRDLRVADFDHDGRADVLVFVPYEPMHVLVAGPSGFVDASAKESFKKSLVQNATAAGLTVADLDGDGKTEVLLASGKNFARSLAIDESAGGALNIVDQFNAQRPTAEIVSVGVVDSASGPSRQVVLVDKSQNALIVLERGASGVYETVATEEFGAMEVRGMITRDLDGDGKTDVLVYGDDRFAVLFAGGNEPNLVERSHYETTIKNARYGDLIVGDLTGDGKPDVALFDVFNHLVDVVTLGSGLQPRSALDFRVFEEKSFRSSQFRRTPEPREGVIADVTGDGRQDLVLLVHDRILVYPQEP
ncbi:MAG: VCBS repeat-containing protein [Planctomycetes bacterium]|nr:VCBS repeat-containing protein [Planctomycetota bacterium]MBI3844478.1 VCBS repeat-containing protein [Planctomycetota bacterium]